MESLQNKIQNFEFSPEIYVYPTPRVYKPITNFSLKEAIFSQELNLYVHIPFCKQVCSYCGYLKTLENVALQEEYVSSLIKEIQRYGEILENKTIKTLHFGGGTPSLLNINQLKRIINTFLELNPNLLRTAEEVSIETTPESVKPEKFLHFKELGINRVSLGIQSLNDIEIGLAGRCNYNEVSKKAIESLRKIGVSNLVIDLMIGIEGQNVRSFENSVKELIKFKPETVELYALGVQPNTKLAKKTVMVMTNKDIYACYDLGRQYFLDAGYKQDCHNRYVLLGKGSFLQEDYIFKGISVIGFGAGARSYANNIHYRNSYDSNGKKAVSDYIQKVDSGNHAVSSAFFLSPEEKMHQYAIYNIESLDINEFEKQFETSFKQQFSELYTDLLTLGLAKEKGNTIQLTNKGLNFRDLIAKELFSNKVRQIEGVYRGKR